MHEQFRSYSLNEDQSARTKTIARAFDRLLTKVEEVAPNGRELSIARTNLETACFYAKKAILAARPMDLPVLEEQGDPAPIVIDVIRDRHIAEAEKDLIACARAAHEANRAYCIAIGDNSQPSWDNAPPWQRDSALMGVPGALNGNTPEQSHESWLEEKRRTGWKYGPTKNPETKEHPCFVPYDDLPPEQRAKDHLFITTVRAVGAALAARHG